MIEIRTNRKVVERCLPTLTFNIRRRDLIKVVKSNKVPKDGGVTILKEDATFLF